MTKQAKAIKDYIELLERQYEELHKVFFTSENLPVDLAQAFKRHALERKKQKL